MQSFKPLLILWGLFMQFKGWKHSIKVQPPQTCLWRRGWVNAPCCFPWPHSALPLVYPAEALTDKMGSAQLAARPLSRALAPNRGAKAPLSHKQQQPMPVPQPSSSQPQPWAVQQSTITTHEVMFTVLYLTNRLGLSWWVNLQRRCLVTEVLTSTTTALTALPLLT